MKSSNTAFSVYNEVKQIFLEFSHHHKGRYSGHIDYMDLKDALSAALDKDISQDQIDETLQSFRDDDEREGSTERTSSQDKVYQHGDDDVITVCSRGQLKINMSQFLIMMQHFETIGDTIAPPDSNGNQLHLEKSDDGKSAGGNIKSSHQSAPNRSISLEDTSSLLTETSNLLYPHRKIFCIQNKGKEVKLSRTATSRHDDDFTSAFSPTQMRYLALVSHNGMKSTMKHFVIANKNLIKKFCLTGTNSTMAMLREVIGDDPDVVYGPSCSSGPLGGHAELSALMTQGRIGGIIFFQDPMSAHPHRADIDSLNRLALVHNTMIVNNPTTAVMMMDIFRSALKGPGRPELIPSFFFSMVSPSVASYQAAQKKMIQLTIADEVSVASTAIDDSVKQQPSSHSSRGILLGTRRNQAAEKSRAPGRTSDKNSSQEEPPVMHINATALTSSSGMCRSSRTNDNVPPRSENRRVAGRNNRPPSSSLLANARKKTRNHVQKSTSTERRTSASLITYKTIDTSAHTTETEIIDASDDIKHLFSTGRNKPDPSTIVVRKITPLLGARGSKARKKKNVVSDRQPQSRWRS